MSTAKSFIAAWFSQKYYFKTEDMAKDCIRSAADAGISPQDITEEIGDLTEYMRSALARGADEYVSERAESDG